MDRRSDGAAAREQAARKRLADDDRRPSARKKAGKRRRVVEDDDRTLSSLGIVRVIIVAVARMAAALVAGVISSRDSPGPPVVVAVADAAIGGRRRLVASGRWEGLLRSTGLLRFQPDKYQGASRRERYFEGWYYKFVTSLDDGNRTTSMAVVPGIFYGESADSNETHAFVFVTMNGERQHFYRFNTSELAYAPPRGDEKFYVRVGPNRFSHDGASLDLYPRDGDDATIALRGELGFENPSPWPVSLTSLGAMGPVGWLPFLECTHGVLSFDHELSGSLILTPARASCDEGGGGEEGGGASSASSASTTTPTVLTFDNGRGYTEKDFGRSFPSTWVWIQTNSFPHHPGTSLFVSVARVPVLGLGMPGFTAAVWHDSTLYPFATWSGAYFEDMRVSDDEVYIAVRGGRGRGEGGGRHRLEVTVDRRDVPEVLLYAPVNSTRMAPFVSEALRATVRMILRDGRTGDVIVDDVGLHAGLEVHGNVRWLVDNVCGREGANKFVCL